MTGRGWSSRLVVRVLVLERADPMPEHVLRVATGNVCSPNIAARGVVSTRGKRGALR
jgi:hypothetical protein